MNIEQRILCLAARTRLDGDAEGRLLELLRGPLDWERLWEQGHIHEVLPLVSVNLQRLQGQAPIPAPWMARARRRSLATMMRNAALADELVRVLGAFAVAGVEVMPVKGIVLAETLYGSLALRPASDLDILVRPGDLAAARAALYQLGFGHRAEPLFAELYHPYHDLQYFRATDSGEVCLELHWALWDDRAYHLATDTLWERSATAALHGAHVRVLSPEDTLLHLAIHRSRSALRLRFVCDVAELLRQHGATLDWEYVLRQARVGGARAALFFALALPGELLGAPLPDDVLARLGISRVKRRLLEHTCGVTALFRPVAPGDVSQQPSLKLRLLEQDGLGQIMRALGHSVIRTGWKHIHNYRRSWWPARGKGLL